MKQKEIKVLVLMSTYNGAQYIEEQIDSILHQDGVDIRLFIRDDGSTDATVSILQRYENEYKDRVSYISGKNLGYGQSFLHLLASSNLEGVDYVAFSDQDDVWLSEKLIQAVQKMIKSDAGIYGSSLTIVDANLKKIGFYQKNELFVPRSIFENATSGNTMVINIDTAQKIRRIMAATDYSFVTIHDWYVYVVCIATGSKQYIDSQSYILYRQHGANSLGHRKDTLFSVIKHLRKMYHMFIQTATQAEKQIELLLELPQKGVDVIPKYSDFLSDYQDARTSYSGRVYIVFKYRFHRKIVVQVGYVVLCLLRRFPKSI